MRSHACDVASKFTNWFSISVKRCLTCDAKNAANWANHATLWVIVLLTSLSQLITNRFFLLCMIFSMHYCYNDARYMLLSRRLTQRRLMFNLRRSRSRRKFEFVEINIRKKWKMIFHHQSIESKLEMRQIQTIQTNIVTIYVFADILKNHFFMSTLSLLSSKTLNSRSTRRKHSASRQKVRKQQQQWWKEQRWEWWKRRNADETSKQKWDEFRKK